MHKKMGFTLIELVMIIVILGILAAVAIPKFFDLQSDANQAAEKGVLGGVRSGIHTYYAKYKNWPSQLDANTGAACTTSAPCFDNVLAQGGITADWTKSALGVYTGPAGGNYSYTAGTGEFK